MQNYCRRCGPAIVKNGHISTILSSICGILRKKLADRRIIANFVHTFKNKIYDKYEKIDPDCCSGAGGSSRTGTTLVESVG
jgi:hypothetical protein